MIVINSIIGELGGSGGSSKFLLTVLIMQRNVATRWNAEPHAIHSIARFRRE